MKPQTIAEIEKELDMLLDKNNDWNCGLLPEEIKSFLLSKLSQVLTEVGEEVKQYKVAKRKGVNYKWMEGRNATVDKVQTILANYLRKE